jgi:hypothetical protein
MTTSLLAATLAARLVLVSTGAPPDPCSLVSEADIASALGSRPSPGRPNGPSLDEDTGALVSSCSRQVGELFLSIGVAEVKTSADAAAALKETQELAAEDEESIQLSPEPGPGDRALWGANAEGAIWVVHEGRYLLNATAPVSGIR